MLRSDINRIAAGRPRGFPALQQIVLDSTDARRLAEFYRALLGYRYRALFRFNGPSPKCGMVQSLRPFIENL